MIEWTGNIKVITMSKCVECATCTEEPPNEYGNAYCVKHAKLTSVAA